jgi:hypothetical protein
VDCNIESASDEPAAGENPSQPQEQQDPARATAYEAALKRDNRPENLQMARCEKPPATYNLEASDQCRNQETPLLKEWRFAHLESFSRNIYLA